MFQRLALASFSTFVLLASLVDSTHAAVLNLRVAAVGKQSDLDKESLYAVEISCQSNGAELQQYVDKSTLIWTRYTTSHTILISTQPPSKKADSSDQLPASTIIAAPIFSVDDKGAPLDNRAACDQSYLVKRADKLFLVPAVSLSTKHDPGFFLVLAGKLLDVASSVVPLFLIGNPLDAVTKKIADVKKVQDPMQALIASLNEDKNQAATTALKVGTTKITTDYGSVTVKLRPVTSIVADKNRAFIDDLRKQIQGAPDKIAVADAASTCITAATKLNASGIRADADKAYALGFLALNNFTAKPPILACLGSYKAAAVKLGDLLWSGEPPEVTITQADLDATSPPTPPLSLQPSFNDIRAFLDGLMVALGQFARNPPVAPAITNPIREIASQKLAKMLPGTVTFLDNSFMGRFGGTAQNLTALQVVRLFETKGFKRFGCFAEATDMTGKYATGASAIFLSFIGEPEAKQVAVNDGITVHPIFSGGSIHQITVSDNTDWIKAVLKDRDKAYDCNGLEIKPDQVAGVVPANSH